MSQIHGWALLLAPPLGEGRWWTEPGDPTGLYQSSHPIGLKGLEGWGQHQASRCCLAGPRVMVCCFSLCSYSLRLATRCPTPAAPYITRQCRSVKATAAAQLQGPLFKE